MNIPISFAVVVFISTNIVGYGAATRDSEPKRLTIIAENDCPLMVESTEKILTTDWVEKFKINFNEIAAPHHNHKKTKVLILTGTHGYKDGGSALTKKHDNVNALHQFQHSEFYNYDVEAVNKLKRDWKYNHITFKVLDVARYHGKPKTFKDAVKNFSPTAIVLAFCYSNSNEGDVKEELKQLYRPQRVVVNRGNSEIGTWNLFSD